MSISKRIGIHRLLHSHEWPEIDRWIRTCHAARHKVPMKKYKECYESLLEHFPRQSVLRIKFDLWYWEGEWHLSLLHGRNYPGANPRRATLLKLYPGQQISETEALARWLVWVAERYGTEWSAIWNQWKKEWRQPADSTFVCVCPAISNSLDSQYDWLYWTAPKRWQTLPEETRSYLERRMSVQRLWFESDPDRADNRQEMICRNIETRAEAIAVLRGCRHLFVRFCSSRKYGVTCEEASSILDSLHKATGGTAEVVFDSDTLSWTGWVLIVEVWAGSGE